MSNVVKYGIAMISGIIISLVAMTAIKSVMNYNVNIIDLLMLIVTFALTIAVVYLNKSIGKKNVARDIITKDLMSFCEAFEKNKYILEKLHKQEISCEDAKSEINMNFHRSDLIAEMIAKELMTSFPNFLNSKEELTVLNMQYWKWLTGGEMYEANFNISASFMKEHETRLINLVSEIKNLIHKLIRTA